MSERVPEGWSTLSLDDLGTTFNGLTGKSSKDFGEGEPFINYLQVFNNTLGNRDEVGLVKIENGENQSQLQFGDIIFTTSSETPDEIGMTSVFLEEEWFPYLNSFCFGLRSHDFRRLAPQFGKHLFRGDAFRLAIKPLAQGSTRFNLSKGNLKKLTVTLPPLPEQKKIASILTSVDEVIEKTQSQIDKLQDLKKGTMNELLTKGIGHTEFKDSELGRIPKSWEVCRLGDILTEKPSYGANASATNNDFATVRYIRITDVNEYGQFRSDSTAFIKDSDAEGYLLANNDLLIARTGNTVGKTYLHESGKCDSTTRFAYAGYLIRFRFNNERARPKYIFQYTLSKFFKDWVKENSRVGAQPNINAQEYSSFVLPLPNLEEQNSIVSILLSIDEQKQSLYKKLSQTQSLKKSLMQDLLTGKVRVSVN